MKNETGLTCFIFRFVSRPLYNGLNVNVYVKPVNYYSINDKRNSPITYIFDSQNRLQIYMGRDSVEKDYTYNDNQIVEKDKNGSVLRTFYLENNNLIKIEQFFTYQGVVSSKNEFLFQDYDNNPNPFKNKFYLLGAFYRAFSENNFKTFTLNKYQLSNGIL